MKLYALALLLPLAVSALDAPYPKGSGHGSYEVPTTDEDLKPFARYPIDNIDVQEVGDVTHISYALPLMLTGAKNIVQLTSKGASANGTYTQFEGPNAVANCNNTECRVRYHDLTIDPAAVKTRLLQAGVSGDEIAKRLSLTASFSGDPVGIIHFTSSHK